MTNFHILTLFPEMVLRGLGESIIGRAGAAGHISIEALNIRDYTRDKHKKVDDYPYGGGAGMLMQAQPVYDAYLEAERRILERKEKEGRPDKRRNRVIYVTPQGTTFHQQMAKDFAEEEDLIFLCGHYEGIDERVLEAIVTDQVSIGDYVLTGGELAVMVVIDAVARLVPGVLNNGDSAEFETFHDHLLEYPQYTRPEVYEGRAVPEVLLSGHHAKIEQWRRQQSIERTRALRPELLERAVKEGLV